MPVHSATLLVPVDPMTAVDELVTIFDELARLENRAIELAEGMVEQLDLAPPPRFFPAIHGAADSMRRDLVGEGCLVTWEQQSEAACELRTLLDLSRREAA